MKEKSKITLKSLSEKLGISVTTVSRALSGKGAKYRISEKTIALIQKEAKKVNFEPNQLARGLRLQKTFTIGLLIPDISNSFFSAIARSIENEARDFGYSILLSDSQENSDIEKESLKLLESRKVDGIIVAPVGDSSKHFKDVYNKGLPLVIFDRFFKNLKIPYVGTDNYNGALEGVSHLIKNGHKKIVCIQGRVESAPNIERVKGYRDALKAKNIKINESFIVGNSFGEENGYVETKKILKFKQIPTAIFACSNQISFGAMRAITEEGLSIPNDISIVSFDEQPYSPYLATPMTTIAQQKEKMGKVAVELLLNQINSETKSKTQNILLPASLIKRESVKSL